jgi:hypothetical protein
MPHTRAAFIAPYMAILISTPHYAAFAPKLCRAYAALYAALF